MILFQNGKIGSSYTVYVVIYDNYGHINKNYFNFAAGKVGANYN